MVADLVEIWGPCCGSKHGRAGPEEEGQGQDEHEMARARVRRRIEEAEEWVQAEELAEQERPWTAQEDEGVEDDADDEHPWGGPSDPRA